MWNILQYFCMLQRSSSERNICIHLCFSREEVFACLCLAEDGFPKNISNKTFTSSSMHYPNSDLLPLDTLGRVRAIVFRQHNNPPMAPGSRSRICRATALHPSLPTFDRSLRSSGDRMEQRIRTWNGVGDDGSAPNLMTGALEFDGEGGK